MPSADEIVIIIRRYLILAICAYETMNSTPSIMDATSTHVFEYRSYQLLTSVVLTLKDVLGHDSFVSGGNK